MQGRILQYKVISATGHKFNQLSATHIYFHGFGVYIHVHLEETTFLLSMFATKSYLALRPDGTNTQLKQFDNTIWNTSADSNSKLLINHLLIAHSGNS